MKISFPIAPDFVMELKSRTDRALQLRRKMQAWIDNGVKLAWLIDADRRMVWIYSAQNAVRELNAPETVVGKGPVVGFELEMGDVYRGLSD